MQYGCCGGRGFLTREEKLEALEEYKNSFEQEVKGVSEKVNELRKAK